jgi:hypothetical protein
VECSEVEADVGQKILMLTVKVALCGVSLEIGDQIKGYSL